MPKHKAYAEVRKAFTQLLTLETIVEDKEEMELLIDAFAKHVSLHYSEEEIQLRMSSSQELMKFFKEYLDHLSAQLYTKKKS